MKISGWGKNISRNCKVVKPKTLQEIRKNISSKCIARGLGRSYGDCSLQPLKTIVMTDYSKILNFDEKNGIIELQSGVKLIDLLKLKME